jgi:hypothetical protein
LKSEDVAVNLVTKQYDAENGAKAIRILNKYTSI